MEVKIFYYCNQCLTFLSTFDTTLEKDQMLPIGSKVKHDCPKLILWLLKGHAYWKRINHEEEKTQMSLSQTSQVGQ